MAEMTAEERVREWSGKAPVQQVFMDGYCKDSTSAATAIFEAMEIMANLVRDRDQAVEQERKECASIAANFDGFGIEPIYWPTTIADRIWARGKEKSGKEGK